jgi:copper chaperone NosL
MKQSLIRTLPLLVLLPLTLLSCGQGEPAIDFGKAECAHCRMNVVDKQYGAALTTQKGRQYVFDDISCMVLFVEAGTVAESQVAGRYVCDHSEPGTLIDATTAYYLHGPAFRSPMRGDVAAFKSQEARDRARVEGQSEPLDWQGAREAVKN